jgi:hypothetical protein
MPAAGGHGAFQGREIVARHEPRSGQQGLERLAIFFLAGDGQGAEGAPVEGVEQGDGLVFFGIELAAVGANDFERALHGLGAGVAEEDAIQAGDAGDALRQGTLVLVVIEVGAVDHARSLLANDLHQARVPVAQSVDANAGDEIQVAFARPIPHIAALAALQHQRIAGVVLEQVLFFEFYGGNRGCGGFHLLIVGQGRGVAYNETCAP